MICKKCGANIEENLKFCGECGEKVEEQVTPLINEVIKEDKNIQIDNIDEGTPIVEPLFQTEIKQDINNNINSEVNPVETVQPTMTTPVVDNINDSMSQAMPIPEVNPVETVQPTMTTPVVNNINDSMSQAMPIPEVNPVETEQPTMTTPVVNNVSDTVVPVMPTPQVNNVNPQVVSSIPVSGQKKKNNSWIFVVLGILLGLIALTLVYVSLNKSSNGNVKVLEKALGNISLKGENSGTIDAKLLIQSDTEDAMNLSASIKYAKQGDDNYNFNLTLNKSMFFDEINLYASILDDKATLFINSSLIDMLGLTSSTPSMWVHMTTTEQDLEMQTKTELDEVDDIDLSDILDENHFKLIEQKDDLNHYQLIIDNDLINKIKLEASKEEDLKSVADSLTELTETYYVDFYINNSNELVKISMDLTNSLNDESIKSAIISFEFNNFGSTLVEIPTEAKNSIIDLETYMSKYAIKDEINIDPSLNQDYTYQY